jgi:hypothetical protein
LASSMAPTSSGGSGKMRARSLLAEASTPSS